MGIPERRRHPRRAVESPLILIRPGPKEVQDGAVLRDVSLDGLAFETTLPLDAGAPFEFALHVPNSGWVEGKGLVCWSKEAAGGRRLCGASVSVTKWNQRRLLRKWLRLSSTGLLKFFFGR